MAKIVVLASKADSKAAAEALDTAGVEYEVVDPTPAAILHLVIGMVDDSEEEPAEEEPAEEEPADDSELGADASAVPESLGYVLINGELIEAVKQNVKTTTLYVPALIHGAKTSYTVNESTFSFWPADIKNPSQRVLIETNDSRTAFDVEVRKSKTGKAHLSVGEDLADFFIQQ